MNGREAHLTRWRYTCGNRHGTVVTATPHERASLADAVIAPSGCGRAGGRTALATLFARFPGLTLAAVPIGTTGLLLGDRLGDTTVLGHGHAGLAAAAACLWPDTGRPLSALAAIEDPGRFDRVSAGSLDVLLLDDFGQYRQHIRLVHR